MIHDNELKGMYNETKDEIQSDEIEVFKEDKYMRGGGNMQQMMKQMQKMQKKMNEEQEKLKEEKVQGTAGGGMVTVTVSGHKEVLDVEIKEEAVDPDDIEMLQDLVIAATNEAMNKADELTQERLGKHTQGLNIPGM